MQQFALRAVFIVTKVMNLSNYILKDILDVTVVIQSLEEKNVTWILYVDFSAIVTFCVLYFFFLLFHVLFYL